MVGTKRGYSSDIVTAISNVEVHNISPPPPYTHKIDCCNTVDWQLHATSLRLHVLYNVYSGRIVPYFGGGSHITGVIHPILQLSTIYTGESVSQQKLNC